MSTTAIKIPFAPGSADLLLLGNARATLFSGFCQGLSAAESSRGKALFLPLHDVLTVDTHGPEMDKIRRVSGGERGNQRFAAATALSEG